MPEWLTALQPPTQAAIISAAVSIAVALIVAFLNPLGQRQLERLRLTLQRRIEEQKADYQERIEKQKLHYQKDLEHLKATLKRSESAEEARQSYEYDARKNLYVTFQPILFQTFEIMESAYFRISSLVRTSRHGNLLPERSWLGHQGYYFMTTIYYLFAPLAVFRIMKQAVNFLDLKLDPEIRIQFNLTKMYAWSFTDDFTFAKVAPELRYNPDSADQIPKNRFEEQIHYKQGVPVGHLESFVDNLLLKDGERQRVITYAEFASNFSGLETSPAVHMFLNFDFSRRPVLARMLLAQALISRLILYSFVRSATVDSLKAALHSFCATEEANNNLRWWPNESIEPLKVASSYIKQRLNWISPAYYDIHD